MKKYIRVTDIEEAKNLYSVGKLFRSNPCRDDINCIGTSVKNVHNIKEVLSYQVYKLNKHYDENYQIKLSALKFAVEKFHQATEDIKNCISRADWKAVSLDAMVIIRSMDGV